MNQIRHLLVCFVALFIVNHCNAECGGTFTGVAGTILSDEYVSNMHCLYRITPPSSEYTYVQIAFSSLSTESGYDFVTVFNGPSNESEVLSKFSGWTIPPTFYSNQPYMTVQFDTDAYVNMNGWILSYQYFTAPAPACAGPRYYPDSMTYGTISFEYVGTSTQEVTCEVVVDAKSYIIYDDYNCQNNVQFSLYSWMDSTLSASFDIYDGPGMYSPWAGSFSSASQIFDSIIVPQRDTFIYLTYSVSSTPSSYSSIDVYFSLTTTCDDEDSHHNSIFILWFTPVIAVSVCLICVVVSIAYRSSKARKNKQTSQYQNLAVPLQAVPQVPHSSNTAPPVFHPMASPYSGTPASNPYGLPQNEAVIYPQYHPVYAPMNQPMPGLYPNAIPHSLPAVGVPLHQ